MKSKRKSHTNTEHCENCHDRITVEIWHVLTDGQVVRLSREPQGEAIMDKTSKGSRNRYYCSERCRTAEAIAE